MQKVDIFRQKNTSILMLQSSGSSDCTGLLRIEEISTIQTFTNGNIKALVSVYKTVI